MVVPLIVGLTRGINLLYLLSWSRGLGDTPNKSVYDHAVRSIFTGTQKGKSWIFSGEDETSGGKAD